MRIGRILIGIAVLLIVVVVGAYLYLLTIDPNDYRDEIAGAAREATGRDLVLGGPLELEISLQPSLVAEDVSFANAPWGSRPQMATLQRLEVQVQLLPLLSQQIQVERLVLLGADILLETDKDGTGNWAFGKAGAAPAEQPAPGGQRALPLPKKVLIENARLTWRDGRTGETAEVDLASFTAEAESFGAPLSFTLTTTVNQIPIQAEGEVGALSALTAGEPWPVQVAAEALGLTVGLDGTVRNAMTAPGVTASLKVTADDLSGLRPVAGDAALPEGKLALSTEISGDAKAVALKQLSLSLGELTLAGDASLALAGPRPRLEANLSADKLDLTALMPPPSEAQPGAGSGVGGRPGKVFPNDPLPLEGLSAADAKIALQAKQVVLPGLVADDFAVELALENGRLAVQPFKAVLAGNPVSGTLSLDSTASPPRLAVMADAPGFDLGAYLKETGVTDLLEGKADIKVDVNGQGRSVAELMGSLNGETKLLMDEGRARTQAFDALIGGLSTVMGTLSPGKSEWTVLNCVASGFEIKNGIATSQIMLVDTEYSTVVGEGQIDLGQETLDLKVTPAPKTTTLNVAVPVKIGGTLANPTFRPDELSTLRKLGGLLGASAFPPALLLGFGEMGTADDNPCLKIAEKGIEGLPQSSSGDGVMDKATGAAKDAAGAVGEGAGKVLEGVGKGIKGLLGN